MAQPQQPDPTANVGEELARIPDEPLLPVEKQLIAGSLILGLALLGVLLWLSHVLFPSGVLTR